jgi:adenylylsulfate kinase-like enzyme
MAIYLFTGQPDTGKAALAKKLHYWLQADKKNWRKSVFHIDENKTREIFANTDYTKEGEIHNITKIFDLAKYLDNYGNDVVISMVSPYRELREKFKSECKVQEIYCYNKKMRGNESTIVLDYEPPIQFYIPLDTSASIDDTFVKLMKMIV